MTNARCTPEVQKKYGRLDSLLRQFVGGKPIVNHWACFKEIPTAALVLSLSSFFGYHLGSG
jgi:3-methyladenine DNA glycosylase Tag